MSEHTSKENSKRLKELGFPLTSGQIWAKDHVEVTHSVICPNCGRYYDHVEQNTTVPMPTCDCYKNDLSAEIKHPYCGDQITISGEEYRRLLKLEIDFAELQQRIDNAPTMWYSIVFPLMEECGSVQWDGNQIILGKTYEALPQHLKNQFIEVKIVR